MLQMIVKLVKHKQRAETKSAPNDQCITPTIYPAFVEKINKEFIKRNSACFKLLVFN